MCDADIGKLIQDTINRLEAEVAGQQHVDDINSEMLGMYNDGMNTKLKSTNVTERIWKNHRSHKPWWNDKLRSDVETCNRCRT